MVRISIGENDAGQRIDRYLKKTLKNAPLSRIYSLLRKDIKKNGRRAKESEFLAEGDELSICVSDEEWLRLTGKPSDERKAKKQFSVVYEDENVLIVNKPFGLLTHGSMQEKENTLANQVLSYLAQKGEYDARRAGSFTPSPANRLDRNTGGLVVFGKNAAALRELNRMIRERELHKFYLSIVFGRPEKEMLLEGFLSRDEEANRSLVRKAGEEDSAAEEGKIVRTRLRPIKSAKCGPYTVSVVEAELITGRTHQIRAQLSEEGFPLLGDVKYAGKKESDFAKKRLGLSAQLLTAYKLVFGKCQEPLSYLEGRSFEADAGKRFRLTEEILFGSDKEK